MTATNADNRIANFVKKGLSWFAETVTGPGMPDTNVMHPMPNAVASSGWDTSALGLGQLAAQKAATKNVAVKTDAHTSLALAKCIGVCSGTGWITHSGLAVVQFKAGLTVSENDPVYVGVTADTGNATNVLPAVTGDYDVLVGTIVDTTAYATDATCIVLLAPPVGILPVTHA